jgi:hypothetical protein
MQLESTLFGVCVVQIKPQLERLLRLPDDALTKEIQLTQDLLSLFIEYQVPSDLLSFNGPAKASVQNKVRFPKITFAVMSADCPPDPHRETLRARHSGDDCALQAGAAWGGKTPV